MKKTVVIFVLILTVLLVPALWINTRSGVTIQDHFLYRRSANEYKSISGWSISFDPDSSRFTAILDRQRFEAILEWNDPIARFTFDDGEIVEGRWFGSDYLYDAEGTPLFMYEEPVVIIGDSLFQYQVTHSRLAEEFMRIYTGETESFGHIGLVILGIAIYIMAAVKFLFPEETHFLCSRWYYEKPALSADGIMAEKIGAILIMIMGAAAMFAPLFV